MTYLVEGPMPAAVREHFLTSRFPIEEQTITRPWSTIGYTVPDSERECRSFREASGMDLYHFENAQETDRRGVHFVSISNGLQGQRTTPAVSHRVSYRGSSLRVRELLDRLKDTYQTSLSLFEARDHCFDGECRDCANIIRSCNHEEGGIHIHMNCEGANLSENRLDRLYEFDLTGRLITGAIRKTLYPSGQGQIIFETNGAPVAEVRGGTIFVLVNFNARVIRDRLFDIQHAYWAHNAEVLERILNEAFPIALAQAVHVQEMPEYQRAVERRRQELSSSLDRTRQRFITIPSGHINRRVRQLQEELQQTESQAEEYRRGWFRYSRESDEKRLQLVLLRQDPHFGTNTQLLQQFENIQAIPEVIGVAMDGDEIQVYTDSIYIDYQQRRYRIGSFRIRINFVQGNLRIENLSNPVERGAQHPHVARDGIPCFGNISDSVWRCVRDWELEMCVTLVIEFLKSVNTTGGDYANVTSWPRAA